MNTPTPPTSDAIDYTDIANRAQEALGRGVNPSTAKAVIEAYESAREIAAQPGEGETQLPVEIHGTIYNVPIGVVLHIVNLREKVGAIEQTRRLHPVIELVYATEHCLSAAEEGEDYSVSRPMLDAMTTLGLMEKVGRGKWSPTPMAETFVQLAHASPPHVADALDGVRTNVARQWLEAKFDSGVDVSEMVNRFLCWRLPDDFAPDCGISFDGRKDDAWNKNKSWPIGTNLLTADQAKAMFQHCIAARAEAGGES